VIVALQVRRDPEILTENIVYWLKTIRPAVPVFQLGWNPEWPTSTLPWVILFDHEGRELFAGKPEGIEPAIERALAAAPDHVIGGPYDSRKALAETIVADRRNLGTYLARLRAEPDPDPEIQAMIAAAERWFERQVTRIDEDLPGVLEQAEAFDALATTCAGDLLGERAAKERDALRAAPAFAAEAAAETALRRALATLRTCPPHGDYFPYHFTKINYTVIDDPAWVAARVRVLTEFRIELRHIVAAWPGTFAAEEATGLLLLHDVPDITAEAAGERIERAERLLAAGGRPAELHEAWLLLVEVQEGCFGADAISARAEELLSTLRKDRSEELIAAETEVRALREETEQIEREVQQGGSLLTRERAGELMARLSDVAKRSGEGTLLARRIAAYVADLEKSFAGAPRVGVRLDAGFPGPGARIALVDPGTGAALAGLLPGDVVLALGGTALTGLDDFTKAIADRKPGERVAAEVRRAAGEVVTLEILLGRRMP
jgi:hypothetical protein